MGCSQPPAVRPWLCPLCRERQSQLICRVCPHLSAWLAPHLGANIRHLPMSLVETEDSQKGGMCHVPSSSHLKDVGPGLDLGHCTDLQGGQCEPGMGGPESPEHLGWR